MSDQIRVGVGVIIVRNHRILLGERIGALALGAGTWALPGGHLEFGESIEQCAQSEVFEETGLELSSTKRLGFTNDIFEKEGNHCVTLYVKALCLEGEAEIREPDQCKQWKWFKINNLPQPLFLPFINLLHDDPTLSKIS